jgi:hypothetical protein
MPRPTDVLQRLADDLATAAWLLPAGDDLRAHLELLGALPADVEAWEEVLRPWLYAGRAEGTVTFDRPARHAAAGAIALATARAARELPEDEPLATALRCTARWCARSVGAPTTSA